MDSERNAYSQTTSHQPPIMNDCATVEYPTFQKRIRWNRLIRSVAAAFLALAMTGAAAEENYPVHPESEERAGVPKGEIRGPFRWTSEIFPGTVREYWVYVPRQYDASKPACVAIVQDGLNRANGWKLPVVLDNLIHQGAVPVTIGIFINPGIVPAPGPDAQPRFNRSFEYDAMGDRYARFLIEEILPEVSKSYHLSDDPNDRMIAGASSGAICAFNVAWERPDAFRRVLSTIGTYVGLRGGHEFPVLIRKTEPKPIRVFLQDGSDDLNIYAGSWWVANQDMLAALEWAGYDVEHVWGEGGHNGKHAASIMPDALRWLWRDYPNPVRIPVTAGRRTDILLADEPWIPVSRGHGFTEGPAVNAEGEVFFSDIPNGRIHRIDSSGAVSLFADETGRTNGLMFGSDGRLYACASEKKQILAFNADGVAEVILDGVTSNDLVARRNDGFFTDPANRRVYHVDADGNARIVDTGIERPNGIMVSPDQTLLYVADSRGQFVYSFQIQTDGSLAYKQPFFHLHVPHGRSSSGADGMTIDDQGRLYVATHMGIQICDQPGRVQLILPMPAGARPSNVVFGGKNLDTLYTTCGGTVYKRRVNAKGIRTADGPVKPPRPRL